MKKHFWEILMFAKRENSVPREVRKVERIDEHTKRGVRSKKIEGYGVVIGFISSL
jgi:acid phosphatase class B